MPDTAFTKVSVATTGTMTITNRIFVNPILGATFSAVNTGATSPTVTVGTGNAYIEVVTIVVPNSPVSQSAAETVKHFGDYTNYAVAGVTGL